MTEGGSHTRPRIDWIGWGPEIFDRARREDKLILLDSGATWCHWCHVMDRVSYDDPEAARLVNEKFIPVRIDRDRLPDVDAHYQRTPALVTPQGAAGGWPLTVVITPEGHTLMKVTFVPPRADPRWGARPGLIELLTVLDTEWRKNRQKINQAGQRLARELSEYLAEAQPAAAQPSRELIDEIRAGTADAYDARHGGFGAAPKFFSPAAIELLAACAWRGDTGAREMLVKTLTAMARGGVYDQIGGGFHRYSVDERWHVPHFEKMAYDNAALLALYANAYALTGEADFARIAAETLDWIRGTLTARNGRGFYASQDADVGLDDDGDCFTWTIDEFRAVLGNEADLAMRYYGLDQAGDVHGRPGRNVLHAPKTPAQLARLLELEERQVRRGIEAAKRKLLAARRQRTPPAVDRTIFADANGMLIDAHLTAYQRLGDDRARDVAIGTLDALLAELRDERGVFAHYREGGRLRRVGLLRDQAWMGRALLSAYQVTADPKYLAAAEKVADYILQDLRAGDGGIASAPAAAANDPAAIQPAGNWQDVPSRSAASVAAQMLIDLGHLGGQAGYAAAGSKALASHAGAVQRRWGTLLGGYALAVDHLLHGPRSIVVVGPTAAAATQSLAEAARKVYVPGALVLVLDPCVQAQRALLERLGPFPAGRPAAYVCRGGACLPPAHTTAELRQRIEQLRNGS